MKTAHFRNYFLTTVLAAVLFSSQAQEALTLQSPQRYYSSAMDLFSKELYGPAIMDFDACLQRDSMGIFADNCHFYTAICHLELNHPDAEKNLIALLKDRSVHPRNGYAYYRLAIYFYKKQDHNRALTYFKKAEPGTLDFDEERTFYFAYGYSLFFKKQYPEALEQFKKLGEVKDKYYYPARYYMAQIALAENDAPAASRYLDALKGSKIYGPETGYYLAAVYLKNKEYKTVVSITDTLKLDGNRQKEVNWLRGQALFYLKEYAKSWPLLRDNQPARDKLTGPEQYMMGFSAQKQKLYDDAIAYYTAISNGKDTLAQYAWYNAGECYLESGRKNNARNAFFSAAQLGYNPKITEEAAFLTAKLNAEIGLESDAIRSLSTFIENYPNSVHSDEAKTILGELFLSTNNYRDAERLLDAIKTKDKRIRELYQQISYFRARELFLSGQLAEAAEMFAKCRKYPDDKQIDASVSYWLGEIAYNNRKYDEARNHFNSFVKSGYCKGSELCPAALYGLAYTYFKQEKYYAAIDPFKRYLNESKVDAKEKERYNDANLRLADCYFANRNFAEALEKYQQIVSQGDPNADYALFQQGLIYGLTGRNQQKLTSMRLITSRYPNSLYVDDAIFEIAMVNLQNGNFNEALRELSYLIQDYPKSPYIKICHLKRALIFYNLDRTDDAIREYKYVIEKFGKSKETDEAIKGLQTIYSDLGRLDEFFDYVKKAGGATYSAGSQDSLTYEAAFSRYTTGDCDNSIKDFQQYLRKFPQGAFVVPAHYYLAECLYSKSRFEEALEGYLLVIERQRREFLEVSTRKSATILFNKKEFEQALMLYESLENIANNKENLNLALAGQMRCRAKLRNYDGVVNAARKIWGSATATDELKQEARLLAARAMFDSNQPDKIEAAWLTELVKSKNTAWAAEGTFYQANALLLAGKYADCQKKAQELDKKFPSQIYWVARGFMLSAECYAAQNDYFQARAVLQSIIENYETENADDDIITRAKSRLEDWRDK